MLDLSRMSFALRLALILGCLPSLQAIAQPRLSMSASYTQVETLSPFDIDFEHFQSQNLLFTLTIVNHAGDSLNAQLRGTVEINLSDGSLSGEAGAFSTQPFSVAPMGRVVTNLNLGRNSDIKTDHFTYTETAKSRLRDVSLATGRLPAGTYTLNLELWDVGLQELSDSKVITFSLQNPSRIELRAPQDGEVTTEFPFFEFFHEGERALLTVAEKNPSESREDAITRKPSMVECEFDRGQNS